MSPQTAATLIPIFLQFFEHSAPKIRQVAITATNQFLTVRDGVVPRVHPALLENINQYIQVRRTFCLIPLVLTLLLFPP